MQSKSLIHSLFHLSGSAFKLTGDRAIHHGTIMIDVNLESLEKYLNVNKVTLALLRHYYSKITSPGKIEKQRCCQCAVSSTKFEDLEPQRDL
jgi:lipoate-protein ligase A